jgi:xylan 1,4-beta-xylosidase
LNLYGIPKPTYRAFELMHRLGTEVLEVDGSHTTVDAWVVRKSNELTILLTNHALPRHPIKSEWVNIRLNDAPQFERVTAYLERIDVDHANPKAAWREMGEPKYVSNRQLEQLQAASQLKKEPVTLKLADHSIELGINLSAHSVAAVSFDFT